jgi:hypothetical protein
MPPAVLWIWWGTLLLTVGVVIPAVWYLLHRLLRAAQAIEQYAAETLQAGLGIARHVQAIAALGVTADVAADLLRVAREAAQHASAVEQALGRQRLEGDRA